MFGEVAVQPGLRIYCADRTKTYRQEASGHREAIGMAGCRYGSAEGGTVTLERTDAGMKINFCLPARSKDATIQISIKFCFSKPFGFRQGISFRPF